MLPPCCRHADTPLPRYAMRRCRYVIELHYEDMLLFSADAYAMSCCRFTRHGAAAATLFSRQRVAARATL